MVNQSRQRDHPFKMSAFFRIGGVSPLPTFADLRWVGDFYLNYCIEYLVFFDLIYAPGKNEYFLIPFEIEPHLSLNLYSY